MRAPPFELSLSKFIAALFLSLLAMSPAPTLAQAQKAIRLIVPYAAGGPIDISTRLLADKVRDSLGVAVIVDNKPGAGGNLGADLIAKAEPDGLTIGIAAVATQAINPWLFEKMPFDAVRDFTPITQIVRVPNVLVMNTQTAKRLNINTLADFIAYAKANPGQLNYGSGGLGSAGHLAGEMFKARTGIFAVHIPYNGGNPAQLALLTGQVDFNFDNLATAAANIKSGKLKALAVTTATRSPFLPNVPAVSETIKGFAIDTWWGLVAPAKLPPAILNKLNHTFTQALEGDDIKKKFANLYAEPTPTTPEAFNGLIQSELKKYERVVKASGAKAE
jgi:tripartite-type tricarboxylate transporter receptor subunit TctC